MDNTTRKAGRYNHLLLSEHPKVPVNMVLAVIKEAIQRPEIMAAYASAPLNGWIPERDINVV
jgi:hypothetical protein